MLQNNTKLLQHSLDETTQRLFSYETHADAGKESPKHNSRATSKKRSVARSNSAQTLPRRISSSSSIRSNESTRANASNRETSSKAGKSGNGQDHAAIDALRGVSIEDVQVLEETLAMVRRQLRHALLAGEACKDDMIQAKKELDVIRAERDVLVREKDISSLQNAYFGLHPSAPSSRRNSSDHHEQASNGRISPIFHDGRVDAQVQVDTLEVSGAGASVSNASRDVVDNETYRVLAAKFAHVSTVFGTTLLNFPLTFDSALP